MSQAKCEIFIYCTKSICVNLYAKCCNLERKNDKMMKIFRILENIFCDSTLRVYCYHRRAKLNFRASTTRTTEIPDPTRHHVARNRLYFQLRHDRRDTRQASPIDLAERLRWTTHADPIEYPEGHP
jgi:hypothetical protein